MDGGITETLLHGVRSKRPSPGHCDTCLYFLHKRRGSQNLVLGVILGYRAGLSLKIKQKEPLLLLLFLDINVFKVLRMKKNLIPINTTL